MQHRFKALGMFTKHLMSSAGDHYFVRSAADAASLTQEFHRLGRHAIEFDNAQVFRFMSRFSSVDSMSRRHPQVIRIIDEALSIALPAKRLRRTLLEVLQGCKVITARAAAEATGSRYARSTVAEYAALARMASQGLRDYLDRLNADRGQKVAQLGI